MDWVVVVLGPIIELAKFVFRGFKRNFRAELDIYIKDGKMNRAMGTIYNRTNDQVILDTTKVQISEGDLVESLGLGGNNHHIPAHKTTTVSNTDNFADRDRMRKFTRNANVVVAKYRFRNEKRWRKFKVNFKER